MKRFPSLPLMFALASVLMMSCEPTEVGTEEASQGTALPGAGGSPDELGGGDRSTGGGVQPGGGNSEGGQTVEPGGGSGNEGLIAGVDEDPGLDCLSVYDAVSGCYSTYHSCVNGCQDQPCADACEGTYIQCENEQVALASVAGKAAYEALRGCEDSSFDGCFEEGGKSYEDCAATCTTQACADQCSVEGNEKLQHCMVVACGAYYTDCGVDISTPAGSGNNGSGGGPTSTDLDCATLYECEDSCGGDFECGKACYDAGTDLAKQEWNTLIQCGQSQCNGQVETAAEYLVCLEVNCSNEYGVCFDSTADPTFDPGKEGTVCGEGYQCVQTCFENSLTEAAFQTCIDSCYEALSGMGLTLMLELDECGTAHCAGEGATVEEFYACLEVSCGATYQACQDHVSPTGSPNEGPATETGGLFDCVDVYDAVFDICVPEYGDCAQQCTTDACMTDCNTEFMGCMDMQVAAVPANEGAAFEAVNQCRMDNYQFCFDQSEVAYNQCAGQCTYGDEACVEACIPGANEVYEECYASVCDEEYLTCGLL